MLVLRWSAAAVLAAVGGWVIAVNWMIVLRLGGSLVPLVGGLLVALAVALVPWEGLRGWWWVPLVVDWGCMPMLVLTVVGEVWRWLSARWE
jgi:hypothetical protein